MWLIANERLSYFSDCDSRSRQIWNTWALTWVKPAIGILQHCRVRNQVSLSWAIKKNISKYLMKGIPLATSWVIYNDCWLIISNHAPWLRQGISNGTKKKCNILILLAVFGIFQLRFLQLREPGSPGCSALQAAGLNTQNKKFGKTKSYQS